MAPKDPPKFTSPIKPLENSTMTQDEIDEIYFLMEKRIIVNREQMEHKMDETMKRNMDEMEKNMDKNMYENKNEMKINMDETKNKIEKKMDDMKNKMITRKIRWMQIYKNR
jgi:hypothetical protein